MLKRYPWVILALVLLLAPGLARIGLVDGPHPPVPEENQVSGEHRERISEKSFLPPPAVDWQTEVVDELQDTYGEYISLALDPAGRPHVALGMPISPPRSFAVRSTPCR